MTATDVEKTLSRPTFDYPGGTYATIQTISLSNDTTGATIVYTNNGTTPSRANGQVYSAPFTINSTQTIKARAYLDGWNDSAMAKRDYIITGSFAVPAPSVAPGIFYDPVILSLACPTAASTIMYTLDGSIPDPDNSIEYSAPFAISADTTIQAISKNYDSTIVSDVSIMTYRVTGHVATPEFNIGTGTYFTEQCITLSCTTSDAAIYYTTDGTIPTVAEGIPYATPILVTNPLTINARAFRNNWDPSASSFATYILQVPDPEFTPNSGTYNTDQSVSISCPVGGVSIYYTIDTTTPSSTTGVLFSSPISVTATRTTKAIAYRTGWQSSNIVTKVYSMKCFSPIFTPPPGDYSDLSIQVTISCATPNTDIYYTIDGSTPTKSSTKGANLNITSATPIRAIAYKQTGITGWSASEVATAQYFLGTQLPPAYSEVGEIKPLLNWPNTANAQYAIEIASDDDFALIVERASGIMISEYRVENALIPAVMYFWRFASKTGESYGGWQGPFNLIVWSVGSYGPAGGWVFFDKGNSTNGWRWLESAPSDQSVAAPWHNGSIINIAAAENFVIGAGKTNSEAIIQAFGTGTCAARICVDLDLGGKTDWFLPSCEELNLMYINLQLNGLGGFTSNGYWSSTQAPGYLGWRAMIQNFGTGNQYDGLTDGGYYANYVRAIRAF